MPPSHLPGTQPHRNRTTTVPSRPYPSFPPSAVEETRTHKHAHTCKGTFTPAASARETKSLIQNPTPLASGDAWRTSTRRLRPDADPIQHKRLPPAATSRPTRTTTHARTRGANHARSGNATQTCMQCMRGSNKTRLKCKIRISSPPISWQRPADHIRAYGIQPTHTLCPARPDADQRNIYAHTFYIYIYIYVQARMH